MQLFKKDLQTPVEAIIKEEVPAMIETVIGNMVPHLIEAAVLKAQFELTEMFYKRIVAEAQHVNEGQRWEMLTVILPIFGKVSNTLRKQLDHVATTEKGEVE
jgi:hypothetical protein